MRTTRSVPIFERPHRWAQLLWAQLLPVMFAMIVVSLFATSAAPADIVMSHRAATAKASRINGVGLRTVVYVDSSRATYNYATGTITPGRKLITEIRYPSRIATSSELKGTPVLRGTRSYPVIVFAEGYRARPDLYAKLLDAWVRAGYVVVSPEFPDTTYPATESAIDAGYPNGTPENDLTNEPADIAFVIAQLTHISSRPTSFLHRLINANEIILAGQSDGAALVEAYTYDTRYVVNRAPIRAAAIFAGYEIDADAHWYREPATRTIPALVVQSSDDTCNEPNLSVELYNQISGEKYFLEVYHATHLGPFVGSNPLGFDAVKNMSLRFFTHVLSPGRASPAAVIKSGTMTGIAKAASTATVAPIATPAGSPYCAPAY